MRPISSPAPLRSMLTVALAAVAWGGCDGLLDALNHEPIEPTVFQTQILGFRLSDDAPAPGDTVTVVAVIEDSLRTDFEFRWGTPLAGQILDADPDSPHVVRLALLESYRGQTSYTAYVGVLVDDGSARGEAPYASVEIPVAPR